MLVFNLASGFLKAGLGSVKKKQQDVICVYVVFCVKFSNGMDGVFPFSSSFFLLFLTSFSVNLSAYVIIPSWWDGWMDGEGIRWGTSQSGR